MNGENVEDFDVENAAIRALDLSLERREEGPLCGVKIP